MSRLTDMGLEIEKGGLNLGYFGSAREAPYATCGCDEKSTVDTFWLQRVVRSKIPFHSFAHAYQGLDRSTRDFCHGHGYS